MTHHSPETRHSPETTSSPASSPTSDLLDQTLLAIEAFFTALAETRPARDGLPADLDGLPARLRDRYERLRADQRHRAGDEPTRHHLAVSLAVLAAYRELSPELPDEELLPLLERTFVEPLRAGMLAGVAAALDAAPDPFALMVAYNRQRERDYFGPAFTFSHPRDDDHEHVARVDHCYYHQVLEANGAGRLTPVLCAFDANWSDAIDPERHGFAFERPTTIGHGGPHCPFTFRRTAAGAGQGEVTAR
ncbi:L-2-amino-thiazoline-4-carboxylic acid hydrolase [Streptomyces huiliensis]|uniref:L-2-amino-thiazoline-4-carboxylic acid hydrolase n=1 Tax=Streptomyces huiliensis TaxID=2876027 RepID=UPI001CC171F3|nr:L-2-amino-thiazoline-4-carboxylic acid hydrolase [Streptomyces huiliensis]MBZ4319893.1 L-2-amino-thiazoline-4-carboxylic acid hydrolase [Streptomyces huiliensis]